MGCIARHGRVESKLRECVWYTQQNGQGKEQDGRGKEQDGRGKGQDGRGKERTISSLTGATSRGWIKAGALTPSSFSARCAALMTSYTPEFLSLSRPQRVEQSKRSVSAMVWRMVAERRVSREFE